MFFDDEAISLIKSKHSKKSLVYSYAYHVATSEACADLRELIEEWVKIIPFGDYQKFKRRFFTSGCSYIETNELMAGKLLESNGFEIAYEQVFDSIGDPKTPDWTATRNGFQFILEVKVIEPPSYIEKTNRFIEDIKKYLLENYPDYLVIADFDLSEDYSKIYYDLGVRNFVRNLAEGNMMDGVICRKFSKDPKPLRYFPRSSLIDVVKRIKHVRKKLRNDKGVKKYKDIVRVHDLPLLLVVVIDDLTFNLGMEDLDAAVDGLRGSREDLDSSGNSIFLPIQIDSGLLGIHTWDFVSGYILFIRDRTCMWKYRLIKNENARCPLPESFDLLPVTPYIERASEND